MLKIFPTKLVLFIFMATAVVCADVEYDSTRFVSGWGWLTYGRIENSWVRQTATAFPYDYTGEELADLHAGFTLARSMGPSTRLAFQFGMMMDNPVIERNNQTTASQAKKFTPYIMQASLTSDLLNYGPAKINAKYGYFSIKTSPEAQNLGEYLVRSWTYPTVLVSGFEVADKVKMMGLDLRVSLYDKVHQDFIINLEYERHPKEDFDLAYVVNYVPMKLFDVSAGIYWDHAFLTNEKLVVPATDTIIFNRNSASNWPLVRYVDTASGDTVNGTFAGTKVMARAALDPKYFFDSEIFGEQDLKLYGEIAVLGWKDYYQWYEKRTNRMPVMFGFNLPAFNVLDILALEWEWCGNPWANSMQNVVDKRSPVPYTGGGIVHPGTPVTAEYADVTRDNWKWSLYASRKVSQYLKISAQIASDHSPRTSGDSEDISRETFADSPAERWYWPFKDWYWVVRTMVYF